MKLKHLVFAAVAALTLSGTAQAAWYNGSWQFRTQLTLNGGLVPAAQTNFPVLVAWTGDASLAAAAQASGNDILFTAADGTTKLDHEIESYTSATGALAAWVRIPSLASGTNTTVYMYYGNAGAANQENVNAVWDANFRGVWHLVEAPANGVAGTFDSTSSNFTGTPQGFADGVPGSTNAVGIVSGADNFLTDTYNVPAGNTVNRIEVPDNAVLRPNGDFTIEAWVNLLSPTFDQHLVYKWNTANFAYQLMVGNNGGPVASFQRLNTALAGPSVNGTTLLQANTWYHIVGVKSGGNVHVYVNGNLEGTQGGITGNIYQTNNLALVIGATYFGSGGLNGREDEVRFSDSARSASWLQTEYNNVTNQGVGAGKFILATAPEAVPVFRIQTGSYTGNGVDNRPILVGFQPDVVLVKRDAAVAGVVRTSTMAGDLTKPVVGATAAFAGGVKALTSTGFVLGTDVTVNATGAALYHWVAFQAAPGQMAVGTYQGNGIDNTNIATVGFQPDVVWVLSQDAYEGAFRTSSMVGDLTYWFDAGFFANYVQLLNATGFQVGNANQVNSTAGATDTYHYVAWKNTPGRIAAGSYNGDGTGNRNLDLAGFPPQLALVKRDDNLRPWVHKPNTTGATTNYSLYFNATVGQADDITRLRPLGFQVTAAGTDLPNDRVNGNTIKYHYVAFGPATTCCNLDATEGAGTVTVTGAGQFEMEWDAALGGGISQYYDLVEDPARSYPLAGGVNNLQTLHSVKLAPGSGGFAGVNHTTEDNTAGARVDLLEATPTRVRVRQEAFYQQDGGANILAGVKGIGDYSVYGTGRTALRWTERDWNSPGFGYARRLIGMTAHYQAGLPLSSYTPCYEGNGACSSWGGGGSGQADWVLGVRNAAGVTTDFLTILSQDWAAATSMEYVSSTVAAQEYYNQMWQQTGGGTALPVETWNLLTYFKPTNFSAAVGPQDAAVISRSTDYRTPATPTINAAKGSQWQDAAESTAAVGDFYNESEAAYAFNLNPGTGLDFDIDGLANTRYAPFLKIRQWRSFSEAPVVSLEGASLARNVDYRAAVKPVTRAHFSEESWYSTFESAAATSTPAVGTTTSVNGSITFVPARYGNGAEINANGDTIQFPAASNFDPFFGAVELWYKPTYTCRTAPGCDGTRHVLWHMQQVGTAYFILEKTAANNIEFTTRNGATITTKRVALGAFGWGASDWVHLRVTWDDTAPVASDKLLIYVDGAQPTQSIIGGPFSATGLTVGPNYIGTDSTGAAHASGVLDEFRMYTAESLPTPLAHGGLTSDGDEFLADGARNALLLEFPTDGAATRRGQYLYFGSDAKFRGLNVALATVGAGVVADAVDWEFWNGTSWADLEAGCPGSCSFGFTDQTNSFTRNGTVFWTSDPTGWAPYSVNGGPDLYYLRAHLDPLSPAYGTVARESRIATDILLFQYCGDITAASQTFVFGPPPPTTEVTLSSLRATAGDRSVLLEWQTGSELSNLGFHVYRALSEKGPWARLTSSLIPGLGSSAVGQGYTFRDTGLTNGTRYFYRLDDVDASSKTTSHGPVSAVPSASAGDDTRGRNGSGGDKKTAASATCPDWVLTAYGSTAGPTGAAATLRCTRHGDPEAVSLGVLSRDSRSATLELKTGGFYALREPSGTVRVFVPGFDFPQDDKAAALPIRRALVDAVVGRRVQLGGVRALELESFKNLVPSALGKAEMLVGKDGTVRAARREATRAPRIFPRSELVALLPSLFQGETKSAVVEIAPLRFDSQRQQLVLAKRVRVRLLFTGRELGESGRGSQGRAPRTRKPVVSGEVLARIHVTSRGLQAVPFEQVFPGRSRGFAASQLRLERQGEPVAFHLEPAANGFVPGSRLFFHSDTTAGSTDFSAEVAFELVRSGNGVVMPVQSAAPDSSAIATPPVVSRSFETDRFYQPGLLDAPDPWLWEALASGATRAKPLVLSGVSATGTAQLDVYLQGASESGLPVDHHVSVALNGTLVGEAQFAGKTPYRISLSVPASLLREGANELSLTNVADTGVSSLVFLDRVSLAHPQTSSLTSGVFDGTWAETGTATLAASGVVAVLDVTSDARWLSGSQASGGSLRFRAEAGHRYVAVAQTALVAPRVAAPEPSTLRATTSQADYILVAPRAFLAAAEPLVARRQDQGLQARAVAFEEIAAEFGHGQGSAEAIQSFLAYAFQSWARPSPRYVLLLGDASYDPRNFIGTSQPAPLPALWTKTSYLWTVSDPLLAAVNGDDALPDLAIGRLPAATPEQAQALVGKLLAWEDSGQELAGAAALVADNPDVAGDFEADASDIAQSFFQGRSVSLLKLSELGAATRPAILDALNTGLSHLGYVGHGGAAVWASENVWNSFDAPSLQAQSQQPLLVTMNCLNGYFVAPAFDSLSESLLKAEGRGAIAAFSPSGLSLDGPAHQYHRALMAALTSGHHERLGDAILAAQKTYADSGLMPELLSVYHLLGDPAMIIR